MKPSDTKGAMAGVDPLGGLPELPSPPSGVRGAVPDDAACFALWRKYGMLGNVRRHSLLVAGIATRLAERALEKGAVVNVPEVRASALLHDIAKTYCLRYGGGHAQLGAVWAVAETGNYALARGVALHVFWPWRVPDDGAICDLPFFVLYADKRVRHDEIVTIDERFEDLFTRYGKTELAVRRIRASFEQGKQIERALSTQLGLELHESSFDSGWMVERT